MKKIFLWAVVLSVIFTMSCNENHSGHSKDAGSKTRTDSLLNDVMDGHNIGMAKMGRLTRAEQTTRRLLDSIAKLPAKARQAAEPLKIKLDDRKSTRLNSSHGYISYAVFCLKKKNIKPITSSWCCWQSVRPVL